MATETVGITKDDLKEILTAVVEIAKAPSVLEQRKLTAQNAEIEQAQRERQTLAQSMLEEIENKKNIQRLCSHEHRNGDTHAVYVQEKSGPGYFICQKNQCKIRPGAAPEGYKGGDIYDTALFNRLFQKSANNDIFG